MTDSAYTRGIGDALSERRTVFTTALDRLEERSDLLAGIAALLVETLRAPVPETATVQELHMLFTHLICDVAGAELYRDEPRSNAKPSRMVCHESSIILVAQAFRPFSPSEALSRAHGHRALGAPWVPRRRLG